MRSNSNNNKNSSSKKKQQTYSYTESQIEEEETSRLFSQQQRDIEEKKYSNNDNQIDDNNNNNETDERHNPCCCNNSSSSTSSFSQKYVSNFLKPFRFIIIAIWLGAIIGGSFFAFAFLNETTLKFTPPEGTPARTALDARQREFPPNSTTSDMAIVIYLEDQQDVNNNNNNNNKQREEGTISGSIPLPFNISRITDIPSVSAFVNELNIQLEEATKQFPMDYDDGDDENTHHQVEFLQVEIGNYYLLELAKAHSLSSALLSKSANNALVVPLLLLCEFTSLTCRNYADRVLDIVTSLQESHLQNETLNLYFNYTNVIEDDVIPGSTKKASHLPADQKQSFKNNYSLSTSEVKSLTTNLRHGTTGMPLLLTSFVNQIKKELEKMDMITLPVALVVMALTVKSLRLLIIPLLSIGLTLVIAFSSLYGVAKYLIPVSSAAPPVMLTLCISSAIDYNMFLLTRFAEEIQSEEEENGELIDDEVNETGDENDNTEDDSQQQNGRESDEDDDEDNNDDSETTHLVSSSRRNRPNLTTTMMTSKQLSIERNRPKRMVDIEKVTATVLKTAGHTVLISGVTLATSFLALCFFPTNILKSFGIACSATIFVALLVCLNLTPTLLLIFTEFFKNGAKQKLIHLSSRTRDSCCPGLILRSSVFQWLISLFGLRIVWYEDEDHQTNNNNNNNIVEHRAAVNDSAAIVVDGDENRRSNSPIIIQQQAGTRESFTNHHDASKNNNNSNQIDQEDDGSPVTSSIYDLDPNLTAFEVAQMKEAQRQAQKELQEKRLENLSFAANNKNNNNNRRNSSSNNNANLEDVPVFPGMTSKKTKPEEEHHHLYETVPGYRTYTGNSSFAGLMKTAARQQQEEENDNNDSKSSKSSKSDSGEDNFYLGNRKQQQKQEKKEEKPTTRTSYQLMDYESPDVYNVYQSENDDDSSSSSNVDNHDNNNNTKSTNQKKTGGKPKPKGKVFVKGKPGDNKNKPLPKKKKPSSKQSSLFKSKDEDSSDDDENDKKKKPQQQTQKVSSTTATTVVPSVSSQQQQQQQNQKSYGTIEDSYAYNLEAAAREVENDEKRKKQGSTSDDDDDDENNNKDQKNKYSARRHSSRKIAYDNRHSPLGLYADEVEKSGAAGRFPSLSTGENKNNKTHAHQNIAEDDLSLLLASSSKNRSKKNDVLLNSSFRHIQKIMRLPWNVVILILFGGLLGYCVTQVAQMRIEDATSAFLTKGSEAYNGYEALQKYFGDGAMMPYRLLFTIENDNNNNEIENIYSEEFVEFAHNIILNISNATNTPLFLFRGLYAINSRLVQHQEFQNCIDFLENKTTSRPPPNTQEKCDPDVLLMMLDNQIVNGAKKSAAIVLMTCPIDPTGPLGTKYYDHLLDTISSVVVKTNSNNNQNDKKNVFVLGLAAETVDAMKVVFDHFPLIGIMTVVVVIVMVGISFRSIIAPLRCVISILLTEAFVFALLVLVYQDGDLNSLDWSYLSGGRSILWLTPIVSFVFTVGIALDFDLFLLTRIEEMIKEENYRTTPATLRALCSSITIINSCGFVMIIAFSGLFFSEIRVLNELGFTLVLAVFFDCVFVRTIIVPCLMSVLGRFHWWPSDYEKVIDDSIDKAKKREEDEAKYDKQTGERNIAYEITQGSGLFNESKIL